MYQATMHTMRVGTPVIPYPPGPALSRGLEFYVKPRLPCFVSHWPMMRA